MIKEAVEKCTENFEREDGWNFGNVLNAIFRQKRK